MTLLKKMKIFFINLPSTFLHELMHSVPVVIFSLIGISRNILAKIFGFNEIGITKITSFNILPNFKEKTLGSVGYVTNSNLHSFFINIFPIFSLVFIPVFAIYFGMISVDKTTDNLLSINMENVTTFKLIALVVLSFYCVKASVLSKRDIDNIVSAVFSVEFIVKLLVFVGVFIILKYNIFNIDFYINIIFKKIEEIAGFIA